MDRKEIGEEVVNMLKAKDGMYDRSQVVVACMSAIDRWEKHG